MAKNKTILVRVVISGVLLLLHACAGATSQPEPREIIVTRENATLPEGCSPTEVAELIMGFLDAYNSGDQEQMAQFFPNTFEWYSDGVVVNGIEVDKDHYFLTRPGNRDDLLDYAAERHQLNDHLELLQVNVVGPSWHGGADFSFRLRRTADDVQPKSEDQVRYVEGGGAIRCRTQKFWVWSLATRRPTFPESQLLGVCPPPPPGTSENAIIACARG